MMQQLAFDYVGTEYGGFPVCMNIIHDGDVIYDFGVGEDISFLEGVLSQKSVMDIYLILRHSLLNGSKRIMQTKLT